MAIYRNGVCVSAGGGSGGTTDYTELTNKPKINSVELSGNKSLSDLGIASSTNLTTHIEDTTNPHSVTKAQVGLGNVDNTADLDKPVSTATQTALDAKVDAEDGKQLSTNDYTTAEKTKLAGIAAGAEVNVQADWSAESGDAFIRNKPENVSAFTNDAGYLTEVDWSDVGSKPSSFTPSSHAATHASDGSDPVTPASIGALPDTTEIPSALADLTADTTHRTVTDAEKAAWYAKQNALTFDAEPIQDSGNPVTSGGIYTALTDKVDAEDGKGLSTNDYTAAEKSKLAGIAAGAEVNVLESVKDAAGAPLTITGKAVTLSKAAVGLSNVDNTADSAKPVSAAMQTALDGKVDAVAGKGLSTNDYTTDEKNKLAGIAAGADANVLESVIDSSGTPLAITGKAVNLSKAAVGLSNVDNTADAGKTFAASQITSEVFSIARLPVGSAASTVCAGDDARLSDARTPTSHAATHNVGGTDALPAASASSSGLLSSDDWSTFNGKQNALTFDTEPTAESENPVTSGGIATALAGKQNTMTAAEISSSYGAGYYVTPQTLNTKFALYQVKLPDPFLYAIPLRASLTKSNRDTSGVYLTYTWELASVSGNVYAAKWVSTLSSDYLTRTLHVYGSDMTTLVATYVFTRTLDEYGNVVSEVLSA